MKRLAVVAVVGALSLGACTSSPSTEESADSADAVTEEVVVEEDAPQSEDATAANFTQEDVAIPAGDHDIPATIVIPDSASEDAPVPAVVMLHGTGSQKDEAGDGYVRMAADLADAGIASIRIDFMGSGESTAHDADFDLDNAVSDGQSALDHMAALPTINGDELGVLGWSQGGIHALRLAAESPDVKAVVTWSAPAQAMTVTDEQREEAAENGYFAETFDWREPMNTGQSWIDGMDNLDLGSVVESIDVPILVINGEDDDVVPVENAHEIAAEAQDAEVLIIPGADHTYLVFTDDTSAFDELSEATAEFFQDILG